MNVSPDEVTGAIAAPSRNDVRFGRFLLLVVLLAAGVRLWRSPWSASDLAVIPDSVEYAIGAERLVTLGHYDIEIEGVAYPPRFPPWFSFLLAPAYAVAPHELGAGIVPVLALALAAVAAAFVIGNRLAGDWGAVGSAVALACYGEFRRGSMKIMTDVPAVAFALWACVLYLRLCREDGRADGGRDGHGDGHGDGRGEGRGDRHGDGREEERGGGHKAERGARPDDLYRGGHGTARGDARSKEHRATWCCAGVFCAVAFALRLELLALCLPFLLLAFRRGKRSLPSLALFAAPTIAVVLSSALYNNATFGSWTRTGYRFWLPHLHQSMSEVLSPSFIGPNLATLASFWGWTAIAFGSLGAWRLLARGSSEARSLLRVFFLGALPGTLFHVIYFYPDLRYHLFTLAILCILASAGLATLPSESFRRRTKLLLPLIALASIALPSSPASEPQRRIVADVLAAETPSNAVIVSAIEPAYFEPTVLRGTTRRIVPFSRSVEYAARLVMMEWLDATKIPPGIRATIPPSSSHPIDASRAVPVCTFTADEDPRRIEAWVRSGVPVYLDSSFIPKSFPLSKILGADIELVPSESHPWLSRVVLRK